MKRSIVFLLAIILAFSLLVGCGSPSSDVSQDPSNQEETNTPTEEVLDGSETLEEAPDESEVTEEVVDKSETPEEETIVAALAGKNLTYMDEGVEYEYHSVTKADKDLATVGSVIISDYRVVDSEGNHAARDGWKWHIANINYYFFDRAANVNGYMFAFHNMDYVYGITEGDDSHPVRMKGQEYEGVTEIATLANGWIDGSTAEVVVEFALQVPEGYTDGIICCYNPSDYCHGIEWTTTEEYLRPDSLFFALDKQ